MKYKLDRALSMTAMLRMPQNIRLLPLMNRILGLSKCRSDRQVTVSRHMTPGYHGAQPQEMIEYASPIEAATFEGFPPIYIEVAQFDPLHDDGVALYNKLQCQGIKGELHEVPGTCHGFETALKSKLLKRCMDRRIAWLRSVVGGFASFRNGGGAE